MSSSSDSEMGKLSGSTDRRRLLLLGNVLLFILGFTLVLLTIILFASYLVHHLDFASSLFVAAPVLLILAGIFTLAVAAYGLFLWKAEREMTAGFNVLGVSLGVACFLCLVSCILAFLLRQSIAHTFRSTRVQGQLRQFYENEAIANRWNALQRGYGCCGEGPQGYRDWTPADGILRKVPDSCCIDEILDCGSGLFFNQESIPPLDQQIHTKGCMIIINEVLLEDVMPILLATALLALICGLIEIILMLSACFFAKHVKKMKGFHRSTLSLEQGSSSLQRPTASSLSYGHPWKASSGRSTPAGKFQVPYLDSSPVIKPRYFDPNLTSSPKASLVTAKLGYIAENGENGERESQLSGGDGYRVGSPSIGDDSTITAEKSQLGAEAPKKGLWWWLSSWTKKESPSNEASIHLSEERRKEKHRADAKDREETLMNVLKNVAEAKSEETVNMDAVDETDLKRKDSRKGLSSLFRNRSKSRDDMQREQMQKDRARSMDALHQGSKEAGRMGSTWSISKWFSRPNKNMPDGNIEKQFESIDLEASMPSALSDPELSTSSGLKLKTPAWFIKKKETPISKKEEPNNEEVKVEEQVAESSALSVAKSETTLQTKEAPDQATKIASTTISSPTQSTPDEGIVKLSQDDSKVDSKFKLQAPSWLKSRPKSAPAKNEDDSHILTDNINQEGFGQQSEEKIETHGKKHSVNFEDLPKTSEKSQDRKEDPPLAEVIVDSKIEIKPDKIESVEVPRRLQAPSWARPRSKSRENEIDKVMMRDKKAEAHEEGDPDTPSVSPSPYENIFTHEAQKSEREHEPEPIKKMHTRPSPKKEEKITSSPDDIEARGITSWRKISAGKDGQEKKFSMPMWSRSSVDGKHSDIPLAPSRQDEANHGRGNVVPSDLPVRKLSAPVWIKPASKASKERVLSDPETTDNNEDHIPSTYRKSKSRSKSSDESGRRFRDAAKRSTSSERFFSDDIDSGDLKQDHRGAETRKSETDLLLQKAIKLPFRKPTTIGSSEDIRVHSQRLRLPKFARVQSPPKEVSMPHSSTNPEDDTRRERKLTSPTMLRSLDEFDDYNKVRIAGFGVEKLEPKMKASPKEKPKRFPKSRELKEADEERILKIEQEIEIPFRSRSAEIPRDPPKAPKRKSKKNSAPAPSGSDRHLTDHNFMNFIQRSGYYGSLKMLQLGSGNRKWKDDKISKRNPSSTANSDDNEPILREARAASAVHLSDSKGTQYSPVYKERKPSFAKSSKKSLSGVRRASSESSISSTEQEQKENPELRKLRQPQFYLNKADGSILATFESDSPRYRRRGRSYDALAPENVRLPFGKTEHSEEVLYSLEPDLTFLADSTQAAEDRRSRAKSEPRFKSPSRRSYQVLQSSGQGGSSRSKSSDRSKLRKFSAPPGDPKWAWSVLQDLQKQESRQLYRTTLEVESVGNGNFDVKSTSLGRAKASGDIAQGPSDSDRRRVYERKTIERDIPSRPTRRHVSVTTMQVADRKDANRPFI